jgi:hypothetical protein
MRRMEVRRSVMRWSSRGLEADNGGSGCDDVVFFFSLTS